MSVQYLTVKDHVGQRLDNFLIRELRPVPRSRVMRMIRKGEVRVNGKRAKVNQRLSTGDKIRVPPVTMKEKESPDVPAWLVELVETSILSEDERLIVLNKPSGIAVHAGGSIKTGVVEALRQSRNNDHLDLVHRLDRETSGCVVVAKTRIAMLELHEAFRSQTVFKRYEAIVSGVWPEGLDHVDVPLSRYVLPNGERRVEVDENGKLAITGFQVRKRGVTATWLDIFPKTGRTHQIRVHAQHVHHPVLGDSKYGEDNVALKPPRMLLHASEIAFGGGMSFTAPLGSIFDEFWQKIQ